MFSNQPHVVPFSTRGLIDYLVELIISEDDAFYLLDKPMFQPLLHFLWPALAMKDIPHRTKICEEVLACAAQAKMKVKAMLQVHDTFVCQVKC